MFTGIIQALGTVDLHEPSGGDLRLGIGCGDLDLAHRQIGDSIAVNGVCLTAVELGASPSWPMCPWKPCSAPVSGNSRSVVR